MADSSLARSPLQRTLLALYRRARQSRAMRSPVGQRAFEGAYLFYKVALEAGPIARLKPYVPPGSWTIDVGANIGMFSLRFARWTTNNGRVIAIEPETANFASLQRRLAATAVGRNVIALQAVAAETTGVLRLQVNPDHPGDHRIGVTGVPIPAVSLDDLLAEHGHPTVSLIKIDVQGAETRVLRGATGVLARCRPALFVEVDDAALRIQQSSADELVQFLAAHGYLPYRLARTGPPRRLPTQGLGREHYEDVLFLNEHGPEAVKAP